MEIAYVVSSFLAMPDATRKVYAAEEDRVVTSLMVGASTNADLLVIIFTFSDGNQETIHMLEKSAFWLLDWLRVAFQFQKAYVTKDNLAEFDAKVEARFLREQPPIADEDWDNKFGQRTVVSMNCQDIVNAFGLILGFKEGEKIYVLPNRVCFNLHNYLLDIRKHKLGSF